VSVIDHPPHYTTGTIEPIAVIEDWNLGFHLGNTLKYIARADHKGSPVTDLEKAAWYLQREIQRRQDAELAERADRLAQVASR
jgi:hypothetical protein